MEFARAEPKGLRISESRIKEAQMQRGVVEHARRFPVYLWLWGQSGSRSSAWAAAAADGTAGGAAGGAAGVWRAASLRHTLAKNRDTADALGEWSVGGSRGCWKPDRSSSARRRLPSFRKIVCSWMQQRDSD
ncbi:hypothetical protein E4U55_003102 [Claviceps digitariae]|nr:hypothetical protein E4U55_003102 [Claviceps digitariae]